MGKRSWNPLVGVSVWAVLSWQCSQPQSARQKTALEANSSHATALDSETASSEESSYAVQEDLVSDLLPPELAIQTPRATLSSVVYLGPSMILEGVQAPRVKIKRTTADFVQLIRCAASYEIKTLQGVPVKQLGNTPQALKEKEWAWSQALQDSRACKIVGTHISANIWPDLAAGDGTFYYAAIPCFQKEHAPGPSEFCAYDISITQPLGYQNSVRSEVRELSRKVTEAEGKLSALIDQASFLAKTFEIRLRACENLVAHDSALNSFKSGVAMLGALTTGVFVGSFIGPNATVMLGTMGGMIGGMMLSAKLGLLPVNNSCMQAPPPKEAFGPDVNMYERAKKYADKYETYFQVQHTVGKLQTLVGQDIPQARGELETLLNDMAALDGRTITAEKALLKANQIGFDPSKPSTYAQSGLKMPAGGLQSLLQSLGGGI